MKTNAESLLRQLKKHQKSVEVYEKARLKMLDKEHRSMGLTDIVVQKELKALGVDVKSLLKDTAAEEKQLRGVHKKFLSLVRPPRIPGDLVFEIPPDPNVFEIRPPAFDGIAGSCGGLDRGFNLSLGETNFETHLQGGGWGWQATAGSPCLTTLVFRFTPPRAGNIMVDAFVDFKGQFPATSQRFPPTTRKDLQWTSRLPERPS